MSSASPAGAHTDTASQLASSATSSDTCSGKVELSFLAGHDGSIENAIVDYQLETGDGRDDGYSQ